MSAANRIGVLLLVGLAFFLGTLGHFAGAQGEQAKVRVQKWEYKQLNTFNEVQEAGEEGWELVAIEPAMTYVTRESSTHTTHRAFFLKRPQP